MSTPCCDMNHSKAIALSQDRDLSGVGNSRTSYIVKTSIFGLLLFSDGCFYSWCFSHWVFFPLGVFPNVFFFSTDFSDVSISDVSVSD